MRYSTRRYPGYSESHGGYLLNRGPELTFGSNHCGARHLVQKVLRSTERQYSSALLPAFCAAALAGSKSFSPTPGSTFGPYPALSGASE